jgi:hypothetical protein
VLIAAVAAAAAAAAVMLQISVHAAADVAATVSSRGVVAIWGLSPVQLLPLQLPLQQQSAPLLPASWTSCVSCSWLTFGGAAAAAAAAAAGVSELPLLLVVHGEAGVDICLVTLSCWASSSRSSSGGGSSRRSNSGILQQQQLQRQSCSSSSSSVCGISLLVHLELPNGIAVMKQILEAAAAPPVSHIISPQQQQQGLVLQTVLVALAGTSAAASEQQQQQRVSDASTGDGAAGQQDVWVAWAVQFDVSPALDDVTAAGSSPDGRSAASAANWKLTISQPQLTLVAAAAAAASEGVGQVTGAAAAAAAACSSKGGGSSNVALLSPISCLQCPSPTSPFLTTGNAAGNIMLWQVSLTASVTTAWTSSPATAPGHWQQQPQQHQCWGFNSSSSSSRSRLMEVQQAAVAGPELLLVQSSSCDIGGTNFGGICVAVALCTSAGYAAAAVTCGQVRVVRGSSSSLEEQLPWPSGVQLLLRCAAARGLCIMMS